MRVLATGRPMGSLARASLALLASTGAADDQIVVSVGPYTFHSLPTRLPIRPASSTGSASPPHRAFKPGAPFHPASSSIRQVAGVACAIVAPLFVIVRASASGS